MLSSKRKFTFIDMVLLLLIGAGGVLFFREMQSELAYEWDWGSMPQYLFRYDEEQGWVSNVLIQGVLTTIRLSVWATLLATVLGTCMGLARVSRSLFWRMLSGTYVQIVRNLPPLVLIFIFYFFVSSQLDPLLRIDALARKLPDSGQWFLGFFFAEPGKLSGFLSGVMTLAVYEGAYISEIVRAGVESVPKGQWDAGASLGFSHIAQLRLVILPQALRVIIPPMAGQFISTIKDSALVSVISIQELTFQGLELMAATYLTFEVWITVTLMYLLLTLTCSLVAAKCERALRW